MPNQNLCDTKVSAEYLVRGVDFPASWLKIVDVLNAHPKRKIYLGITHHPCGRYTGTYTGTTPLPTHMQGYDTGEMIESIDEAAHCLKYDKMFLISSNSDLDAIAELEIQVLAAARQHYPDRVDNPEKSKGGEKSRIPEDSDYYFLYACTSNFIY